MDKKKLLYGLLGLLLGTATGYWGADALNRNYARATSESLQASPPAGVPNRGELPPDHPPTGGADAANAGGGGMQGDVAAVIEQARKAPADFDAQMKAGALFTQIQRHDQALEFYQKAQKLKPNEFAALVALGNANFDLQHHADAERWYKAALKLKPEDVDVQTDLGLTYYLREPKELDKAIAAYRAALGYNPRHEQALQNLITALLAKGDKAAVTPYLQTLEQVNPNNRALAQFRAQAK